MTTPNGDRRSFSSRTPNNENPEGISYRRGFVTRHQVTGWRFVMRRIASGVALHDTRMLVDPLRTQSRSVLVGALILVTGLIGCFLFSMIRPSGSAGTDTVLAERDSAALYVRLGDQLHPVLNLASARLITGRPDNPTLVKSSELDQFARGNLLGIPGAPERMVANTTSDAYWAVCDAATGAAGATGVTVIAGAPATGGERAALLPAGHAVLAGYDGRTWLLWDGKRSSIDLADRAVTDGLGIGVDVAAPQTITTGLFNALPEGPPLTTPVIPGAGEPARVQLPIAAPVGAVVVAYEADNTLRHYVVLADGLQPISGVLASILRNTNSYGLAQPPRLGADDVARIPAARAVDTGALPPDRSRWSTPPRIRSPVPPGRNPKAHRRHRLIVLSGGALPIPDGLRTIDLVSSGTPGGPADRVALPPGTGYLVDNGGALFWVSDTGVRYGIGRTDGTDTAAALGLTAAPLPIPWSVLSQFAAGPTLSRADALLAHDTLAPNPAPARVDTPRWRAHEQADLRAPQAGVPPVIQEGHYHHRATAGAAAGGAGLAAAPGAALPDRHPDRRDDRRPGRHRAAADLADHAVLPVRAAAGGDRAVPGIGQQDAHRGGRRRARRLPPLPLGRPGQCARPRRRATCRSALVPSGTRCTGQCSGDPQAVGTRPGDPDFLVLRAGLHDQALDATLRVKDTADEIDLEPVSHTTLRGLLDTQRTVHDAPAGIDLTKVSRVTVLGEDDEVDGALRAWIAQAMTWHDPSVLGIGYAGADLEDTDWSWLKWLPHVDVPGQVDGVGPARYLAVEPAALRRLLAPALADREQFTGTGAADTKHLLIVLDDPEADPDDIIGASGLAGVDRHPSIRERTSPRTVFGP